MIDIHSAMSQLATSRPLFHSEADFQHALAWKLREDNPELTIRLEYRPAQLTQRGYIDVWAADGHEAVAIELKYKTRSLQTTANGEPFDLLDQSAQDLGRYDTLKDIQRLEQVVAAVPHSSGFVLMLTNDRSYWTASSRLDTVDVNFRLHEGRRLGPRGLPLCGHVRLEITSGSPSGSCRPSSSTPHSAAAPPSVRCPACQRCRVSRQA